MSKPSHLLRKIKAQSEAKYDYLFRKKIDMTMQLVQDATFLAAADVFQMGLGRCEAFGAAIRDYVNEITSTMCADREGDPEYVYTREKVDQRMRKMRRVPRKCSTCARQDCPDRSWLIDWLHCGRWKPKEEDENDRSKARR